MITEIAFYVYPVAEMARARKFYEEVLGLKVGSRFGEGWIEYDIGAGTFAITSMDIRHKPGVQGGLIAFEVDDFEAEIKRLEERGVRFVLEPTPTPVCRFAVIADPDGNHLSIHKRNA
jgi:predicted enzyme related to lactoylglutathione lyase